MIEYRQFKIENREKDSRTVVGYGATFNSQSLDLGFIETIDANAITSETIARSDVFATFNHDTNKILARCKNGSGSLQLSCDEKGLRYQFDAPKTDLGDELLEYLDRGDIDSSSFAFTVKRDKWEKGTDGKYYRTILEVDQLFDVAPVFSPAYPSSSCAKRNLASEYEEQLRALDEEPKDETPVDETPKDEPKEPEQKSEPVDETPKDEPKDEPEAKSDDEPKDEPKDETPKDESEERNNSEKQIIINTNTNKSNIRNMEKKFSLVAELRSAMENGKSIDLAEIAKRAYTVNDEGADVVETDLYDILMPLRAKNVLAQAGAKFMTGLEGNVQIPVMSAGNVAWASELGAAADGSGAFTHVTLSPKRLTAKFPVSLQLLAQDSIDVEAAIRQDIIDAINDKLEESILKTGATVQGDFENLGAVATDKGSVAGFDDLADAEAAVEEANVYGACKYIVSPKAKAALRSMIKGTNGTGMVMEGGEIDGTPAYSTGHVAQGEALYGDFSNLVIGSWGNVQLDVVRDVASLANGCVTIVVNAFFDCKATRPEAFVKFAL